MAHDATDVLSIVDRIRDLCREATDRLGTRGPTINSSGFCEATSGFGFCEATSGSLATLPTGYDS
jgi:hypothetical protein